MGKYCFIIIYLCKSQYEVLSTKINDFIFQIVLKLLNMFIIEIIFEEKWEKKFSLHFKLLKEKA